jgi:hypothetical protein
MREITALRVMALTIFFLTSPLLEEKWDPGPQAVIPNIRDIPA